MDNHPIPQDVTGFEFKLIGEMTVKQFAYVATGAIFGYIIYLFPIPFLFKLPPVAFFALLGFAFAFLPISGRPMDKMIFNFFRAVFSQNQYTYREPAIAQSIASPKLETTPTPTVQAQLENPMLMQTTLPTSHVKTPQAQNVQGQQAPTPQPPQTLSQQAPQIQPKPIVQEKTALPIFAAPKDIPFATYAPNVINGIVKDAKGDVIPQVIVEVKDQEGLSQRAFKTNKLGQFSASTSLPNGVYIIEFEDPLKRFQFTPVSLTLQGSTLPPLQVKCVDGRDALRQALFQTQ